MFEDVPLPLVVDCYVCGAEMPFCIYGEACDSCMNPEVPREYGPALTDGYGNDRGWQDSTFPNEY